jgi:hypothetical protein
MSDILGHPQITPHVAQFGDERVRETTRSLAAAGLLFSRGERGGTVYKTTKLGREIIPAFRGRRYLGP